MHPIDRSRPLKLIITHSPLFRAHWALFIPHAHSETIGTKIHVTGTLATGFEHEFQRDFDLASDAKGCSIRVLGSVDEAHLIAFSIESSKTEDSKSAKNRIEEIALNVPAPGGSLRSATGTTIKPIEVKDCQYWMREYVAVLVVEKMVAPDAAEELEKAPVH